MKRLLTAALLTAAISSAAVQADTLTTNGGARIAYSDLAYCKEAVSNLFGKDNGFGVLMAATIGAPLYMCGGGTIPLLKEWLWDGMSMGSAAAFMITGPATKLTNLGAMKIVLGWKHFLLYLVYVLGFAWITGMAVNLLPGL